MPENQTTATATPFGDNKGIQFSIKTGGKSYNCTLQDKANYERIKASRTSSTESVSNASQKTSE